MKEEEKEEQEHTNEEEDIAELLKKITPFVEVVAPRFIEYQKIKAPQILLDLSINFIIMVLILGLVSYLAFYKIIDGSAATGLIGAVIGYVFGGLYQRKP
ncbi:MAG: hypothetical protein WC568_06490 [Candidatus Methanoperedens sp.]